MDPAGHDRVWEMAVRTTRTLTVDAVSIFPILNYGDRKEVAVIKQFRPPCEKVVLELPAGLVDEGELVELTATRELIEETGFHGKITSSSGETLFSDPGLTNANMALVTMEVDMTDERNKNPKPQLEEGEFIEVFSVPFERMLESLREVCAKEGAVVDARLYHLAQGLALGKV